MRSPPRRRAGRFAAAPEALESKTPARRVLQSHLAPSQGSPEFLCATTESAAFHPWTLLRIRRIHRNIAESYPQTVKKASQSARMAPSLVSRGRALHRPREVKKKKCPSRLPELSSPSACSRASRPPRVIWLTPPPPSPPQSRWWSVTATRQFGRVEFVTAQGVINGRGDGQRWDTPRCITPAEFTKLRRMTDLGYAQVANR